MGQFYITAEGLVANCCWIANLPDLRDYKELHKQHLDQLNINNNSLDEIVAAGYLKIIEDTWDSEKPFPACLKHCGKKDQDATESHNKVGNNDILQIKLNPRS
jgi:hypothetical protein